MTSNDLKRFREILTARVEELERLVRRRDGIAVERSPDQIDEIQGASARALAVSNLDRDFSQLRDARAAIDRIDEGTFGACLQCDEEIHPKRLAAVPWASFCLQCQEAVDRNSRTRQVPARDLLAKAA